MDILLISNYELYLIIFINFYQSTSKQCNYQHQNNFPRKLWCKQSEVDFTPPAFYRNPSNAPSPTSCTFRRPFGTSPVTLWHSHMSLHHPFGIAPSLIYHTTVIPLPPLWHLFGSFLIPIWRPSGIPSPQRISLRQSYGNFSGIPLSSLRHFFRSPRYPLWHFSASFDPFSNVS